MICPLCNNEHGLPDCGEFVKLNMSEKWDAAKGFACFCLRAVTYKPRAERKPCRGGHHRLLHQERTTRGSGERPDDSRRHRPHGGSMKVHALLDEGSTVTLIDEQVANRIAGRTPRNVTRLESQTIRNLKLAPQRVERATVATCSHLTDIAENLIYDAAAPCASVRIMGPDCVATN
ncbi:hypothetical protein EVAR_41018_1 [Eumeta japonica]|uniref:Peptidase A2 domain-containing protein n=1 Tax=Eumeta variegata TaxID=151549 RepID=A0A4C1Z1C4_EUMVA|nr:hypothetical protein EVAR_41018_1 [Eumeta japonica]